MTRLFIVALALAVSACGQTVFRTMDAHGNYEVHKNLSPIGTPGNAIILGQDVTLTCAMSSPATSKAECVGGGFPFTVPAGKTFCLTTMYLQNKFQYDPVAYGGSMRAVYLQEMGVTVSSHHPALTFFPPYPFFAGQSLRAMISNAQSETQNIYAFEQGFLVNEGEPCIRKG